MTMPRVPASVTGDSSDVAVALEVASALWAKGDHEEAIRWLRRAVEAAGEAGDAARAANLALAAGDLDTALAARQDAGTQSAPAVPVPASGSTAPPGSDDRAVSTSPSDAPWTGEDALRVPPPLAPAGASWPTAVRDRDARTRVSVKISVRDPNLLLLRRLADGQVPPTGTREGFLVLGDAEVDARSGSNGGKSQ
jgi:hypothetical protein